MKPIKVDYVNPKMTTYGRLVNEMKEYAQRMEPYKKRFYKFISENPCSDIQMVPFYNIESETIYDYNSDVVKTIPLKVNSFNLDFPSFPHVLNQPENVLNNIEGAVYQAEIRDYDDVEYRSFIIPDAYMEDPSAWEAEVLKRIEIRENLADMVIKRLFPNAPAEVKISSIYSINEADPWIEKKLTTDRLIIRLNTELLPKKNEPNFVNLDSWGNIFLHLETGDVLIMEEVIPHVIPSFKGIEEVGF
ncbi:MAG: hypothetical protein H9W81_05775 [Enterococcus sp.]|nr:hypothetical protein [Enterococcus sp.]